MCLPIAARFGRDLMFMNWLALWRRRIKETEMRLIGALILPVFLLIGAAVFCVGSWWGWHQFFRTDDTRWLMTGIGAPMMGAFVAAMAVVIIREELRFHR